PLPPNDPRHAHIRRVLRRGVGDSFDCGLINAARGKAIVTNDTAAGLRLEFQWGDKPPSLDPITLLIGLPRPQTARKILRELTALGVARMHFFQSAKGEPSYAASSLWGSGEVRRHLIEGAQQAFCTRLPEVAVFPKLGAAIDAAPATNLRTAMDVYEGNVSVASLPLPDADATIALGPERGSDAREREILRQRGFTLAHLGRRVLRSETACVAAVAILKARLGLL
ncbi:MAG: 16S rRNA (uracil(1498)-N(3))-methyltransferase, partial [Opitutaceae bacterium]